MFAQFEPSAPVEQPQQPMETNLSMSRDEFEGLTFSERRKFRPKSQEEAEYLRGESEFTPQERSDERERIAAITPVHPDDLGFFETVGFNLRKKLGGEEFAQEVRGKQGKPKVDTSEGPRTFERLPKKQKMAILEAEARSDTPEFFSQDDIESYKRDSEIEEFRPMDTGGVAQSAKLTGMLAVTHDPEEQANIAKQLTPKSTIRQRYDDAWVLTFPDPKTGDMTERLLNKPGVSYLDAANLTADITKGIVASRMGMAGPVGGAGALVARSGLTGMAGAGIQTGIEAVQASTGGTFDKGDILLEGFLNLGGELLPTVAKGAFRMMSKGGRAKLAASKTLNDVYDAGLNRGDVELFVKHFDNLSAAARKEGIDPPKMEQVVASFNERGYQLPAAKAKLAARTFEKEGGVVQGDVQRGIEQVKEASLRKIGGLSKATPAKALQRTSDTAQEIIDVAKKYRSEEATKAYNEVRKASPKDGFDVTHIIEQIEQILKDTPEIASLKKHLNDTKRALETLKPKPKKEKTLWSDKLKEVAEAKKPVKLPFDMLQKINFMMRDIGKVVNDKSIGSQVKLDAKKVGDQITQVLDSGTMVNGKSLYRAADANYREMSKQIDILIKNRIGRAADMQEDVFGNLYDVVFNPSPNHVDASKRFMEAIKKQDPQAAKDLYSTYVGETVLSLPKDALPSDVLGALFGKNRGGKNMLIELAPDKETAEAFRTYERALLALETTEGTFTKDAAARQAELMLKQGGLRTMLAHMTRATKFLETTAEQGAMKRNAAAWTEAWTNESLAKELKAILKMKLQPREVASKADSVLKRAIENASNSQRRSLKEAAARSAGVDIARELTQGNEE